MFSQTVGFVQQDSSGFVTLIGAGDLLLGAGAESMLRSRGIHAPFDSVRFLLQNADIAIANLEAPFAKSGVGEPYPKQYTFKVPPRFAQGAALAGFDLLTLANNHVLDYGASALQTTLQTLDSLNILHCGAGMTLQDAHDPARLIRNGMTFGFLAYSMTYPDSFWAAPGRCGTAFPSSARLKRQIRELKTLTDYVIVSFHWGGERLSNPKAYQQDYARQAIDAGADVIIGHHPHVVQGVEIYNGKLIAYSLGNFVFGSYSSQASGALLEVEFHPNHTIEARMLPINVNNYEVHFQPRLFRGEKKEKMIRHLNEISASLNSGKEILDSTGRVRFPN